MRRLLLDTHPGDRPSNYDLLNLARSHVTPCPTRCQAAVEIDRAGPHDGVVQQLIGFEMTCPTDTEPYRDRQGMGEACVVGH